MTDEGNKRTVVFLEAEPWEQEFIDKRAPPGWQPWFYPDEADRMPLETIRDVEILSVFIYSDLDAALLEKLPRLRMIATRSTGVDHIDTVYCRERGIVVSNVPTYGANTVAEYTFALLLSLSRKVIQAYQRTAREDFSLAGLRGFDLMGKSLGVIGTGQIGRHVIRIAKGFQMRVAAYDFHPDPSLSELLGFEYTSFDDLLTRSDIVTLHCPLTPATRHLMGREAFRKMKKGVWIINTARGGLIDTEALLWALDEKIVAGAGLDVLEEEEMIREERELLTKRFDAEKLRAVLRNHVLLKREEVLVTPHIAFNSQEAIERILITTMENISGFVGERPQNRVA